MWISDESLVKIVVCVWGGGGGGYLPLHFYFFLFPLPALLHSNYGFETKCMSLKKIHMFKKKKKLNITYST